MVTHPLVELLLRMNAGLPPPEGQAHGLMLRGDGCPGLDLILRVNGRGQVIHLEPDDLMRDPDDLAQEVFGLVRSLPYLPQYSQRPAG